MPTRDDKDDEDGKLHPRKDLEGTVPDERDFVRLGITHHAYEPDARESGPAETDARISQVIRNKTGCNKLKKRKKIICSSLISSAIIATIVLIVTVLKGSTNTTAESPSGITTMVPDKDNVDGYMTVDVDNNTGTLKVGDRQFGMLHYLSFSTSSLVMKRGDCGHLSTVSTVCSADGIAPKFNSTHVMLKSPVKCASMRIKLTEDSCFRYQYDDPLTGNMIAVFNITVCCNSAKHKGKIKRHQLQSADRLKERENRLLALLFNKSEKENKLPALLFNESEKENGLPTLLFKETEIEKGPLAPVFNNTDREKGVSALVFSDTGREKGESALRFNKKERTPA